MASANNKFDGVFQSLMKNSTMEQCCDNNNVNLAVTDEQLKYVINYQGYIINVVYILSLQDRMESLNSRKNFGGYERHKKS
ncbi:unnamed protein product [Acanthoscelides obtectus]|uniref:Uncharacterized protein n=1 Tax=Acanthoscelides obtectus TaxID=200917 RepID=A0A9P0JJP9_ACAOB|nr:unnamed protein product [Acanthoscelides obtectus]CAK1661448.1 hypothetical protein AOBTE_LOCUS22631 [Acanthoscelides obtectus]